MSVTRKHVHATAKTEITPDDLDRVVKEVIERCVLRASSALNYTAIWSDERKQYNEGHHAGARSAIEQMTLVRISVKPCDRCGRLTTCSLPTKPYCGCESDVAVLVLQCDCRPAGQLPGLTAGCSSFIDGVPKEDAEDLRTRGYKLGWTVGNLLGGLSDGNAGDFCPPCSEHWTNHTETEKYT